jgi:glycine cleavage system regulatory protein
MSKSLVITLIGEDRPGIVEALSKNISDYNGEWVESKLANLSGKFSGILRVNFPESDVNKAMVFLKGNPINGLSLQVEEVNASETTDTAKCIDFEIIGHDKPGIVHRLSSLLVTNNATINSLESEVFDAAMTGEKLFQSDISICLANTDGLDELCEEIEKLGVELILSPDEDL